MIAHFLLNSPDPNVYTMTDGIVRPDRNIPLDVVIEMAGSATLWAERGKAIEAYAQLEQSLCRLFAASGEMAGEVAAVIFFKITNSKAQNNIIEKLIHKKHSNTFNVFWNSYLKQLREIDLKRNEIVHWLTVAHASLNNDLCLIVGVNLVPPNILKATAQSPSITANDLKSFSEKCSVFSRICNMFNNMNNPQVDPAWRDIFQQPLVYPLPEEHPLNQRAQVPDIQPQSSQA